MQRDNHRISRIVQSESRRQGEILVLSGISKNGAVRGDTLSLYYQIGAFLAYKSIQQKSGAILEGLPRLLEEECLYDDFDLRISFRDTRFEKLAAARQFY